MPTRYLRLGPREQDTGSDDTSRRTEQDEEEFWPKLDKKTADRIGILNRWIYPVCRSVVTEGSTVLHWSGTADRKGALLVGDSIHVARDRRWVTFMRSYPNLIPLPGKIVRQIADALADLPFERLYGHFWESVVTKDAKNVVLRSVQRYLHALAPAI